MYANITHLMKTVYCINKKNYIILSNYEMHGGKKARKNKITIKNSKVTDIERSTEPLKLNDWISYVEDKNLQLKMDDLKNMYHGNTLRIVPSIIQTNTKIKNKQWKDSDSVNPVDYFDNISIFTYPNILDDREYGRSAFDPKYDPDKIEPFFDDGHGNAVLGSGSDISVLVSNLIYLPNILIEH